MNLDRVTITGADDSISPGELVALSKRFPFVEWGILVSRNKVGAPRYPSSSWIHVLLAESRADGGMQLSLHVCGYWVRQLLLGKNELPQMLRGGFDRVQLNFHAEKVDAMPDEFAKALRNWSPRPPQFVFQFDGANGNALFRAVGAREGIDAVPLFDTSGGAGIVPDSWPRPPEYVQYRELLGGLPSGRVPLHSLYCGYAGGLGPDNLADQLQLIGEAAGEAPFWIDMETKVRSNLDRTFDLDKVARCLEIAEQFIRRNHVSDCQSMREQKLAAEQQPMTIPEAINQAIWARKTPDGFLDPLLARKTIVALLSSLEASPCYFKGARLGIPTFTLLAYDRAGHIAMREWANAAQAHGCRMEKVTDARMLAVEWEMRPDCGWPT